MRALIFAAVTTVVLSSCATPREGFTPPSDPRELAKTLLEVGIGQARPDVIRAVISPDYRQHNPRVPDGPQGLIGFVEDLAAGPRDAVPGVRVLRTIVDGEYVLCHAEYLRGGRRIAAFDLFRVQDGKLAEHWDAGRRRDAERAHAPRRRAWRAHQHER